MENFNSQPMPPGNQMFSNQSSNITFLAPSTQHPQTFGNVATPEHYYPNYFGNSQPFFPESDTPFPPGTQNISSHFYPPQQMHLPQFSSNYPVEVPTNFGTNTCNQPGLPVFQEDGQQGVSTVNQVTMQPDLTSGCSGDREGRSHVSNQCGDEKDTNQETQKLSDLSEEMVQKNKKQKIEETTEGCSDLDKVTKEEEHRLSPKDPEISGDRHDTYNISSTYSRLDGGKDADIEKAAQDAVLCEQEISMQQVIQNQRQVRDAIGTQENDKDIHSGRHDPTALKEHLLR